MSTSSFILTDGRKFKSKVINVNSKDYGATTYTIYTIDNPDYHRGQANNNNIPIKAYVLQISDNQTRKVVKTQLVPVRDVQNLYSWAY